MEGKLLINDYNYLLPAEKIAKFPLSERDKSKLLIYKNNTVKEDVFSSITKHLPENSLLVFNNTRVIHARLLFKKVTGAVIEIFCLQPVEPADHALAFQKTGNCRWLCLVGNLKRWKDGVLSKRLVLDGRLIDFSAKIIGQAKGNVEVEFTWNDVFVTFGQVLIQAGDIPIPPYLGRKAEESDKENYQTIYSKINGSVAAPTAGLHFTKNVMGSLHAMNIKTAEVTLHVGAGTFQPVKEEDATYHSMHKEVFFIKKEVISEIFKNERKIIAVGTTSVRTLESLYWIGLQLLSGKLRAEDVFYVDQSEWKLNEKEVSLKESFCALMNYLETNNTDTIHGETRIMITPGYRFKVVNGIITNFHQPKSTLLLLVSAFIGEDWRKVYSYALENNFRFLSYGDSSLLLK